MVSRFHTFPAQFLNDFGTKQIDILEIRDFMCENLVTRRFSHSASRIYNISIDRMPGVVDQLHNLQPMWRSFPFISVRCKAVTQIGDIDDSFLLIKPQKLLKAVEKLSPVFAIHLRFQRLRV